MNCRVKTLFLTTLLSVSAMAQQLPVVNERIVVTASGAKEKLEDVCSAVAVIGEEEIRSLGATSLADTLRLVPGLMIVRSGTDNNVTSLFLRGSNSTQTLVLYDGVRLNSPFFGGYDWSLPLTAGVGRVEIVRGPYSALYGADALGGVIQLLPDESKHNAFHIFAEVGPRSWRRGEIDGGLVGRGYDLFATGARRDGSGELANDDFTSSSVMAKLNLALGEGSRIGVLARRSTSRTEIPFSGATLTPNRWTAATETLAAIPFQVQLSPTMHLEATSSWVKRSLLYRDPDDPWGFTRSDTEAVSADFRGMLTYALSGHSLMAGGEGRRDRVDDGSSYGVNLKGRTITTRSIFAQDRFMVTSRLGVLLGVRYDQAIPWGSQVSPRVNVSWQGGAVKTWMAYGLAYRAPGLGELYYPMSGNPSLTPERSRSFESGMSWSPSERRLFLQLVAFSNRTTDLIDFDYASFRYLNVAKANQDGFEASLSAGFGSTGRAQLAVSWLDARDGRDQALLRRPEWTASLGLFGVGLGRVTAAASILWVGRKVDIDPVSYQRIKVGGYVIANANLEAPIARYLRVSVRVENLAGRTYQEVKGYPAPGRRVMLALESVLP